VGKLQGSLLTGLAILITVGLLLLFINIQGFVNRNGNPLSPSPPETNTVPITIPYYAADQTTVGFGEADAYISVNLTYQGTLVEGVPITVEGFAAIPYTSVLQNLSIITLSFQNGLVYPHRTDQFGIAIQGSLILNRVNGTQFLRGNPVHIYFPLAGEFASTINPVTYDPLIHGYASPGKLITSGSVVSVEPTQVLQDQSNAQLNLAFTYALFIVAVFEGARIVFDLLKDSKEEFAKAKQERPYDEDYYAYIN